MPRMAAPQMPKGVVELLLGDDAFRREVGLVERNAGATPAAAAEFANCVALAARAEGRRLVERRGGCGRRLKSANRKRFEAVASR